MEKKKSSRVPFNPRVVPDEQLGMDPKKDAFSIVMHYTRGFPLGENLKTNADWWLDLVPLPACIIIFISFVIAFIVLFTR